MFRRHPPAVPVGTYTTWSWPPTPTGYAELRWNVEPRTDPSPVGYFWSHQVALLGGEAAYVGLQTVGSEPAGKIAIFSVWGGTDAEGPDYAAPFGGEGTGMTVRIRCGWVPGRSESLALRADGDGWWRADVEDQLVGRIRVDKAWHGLASTSIMWTERYTPPLRTCTDMGYAVAWFGTPLADGGVAPRRHHNHLGANRGCPGSSVRDADGGVLHVMGGAGLSTEKGCRWLASIERPTEACRRACRRPARAARWRPGGCPVAASTKRACGRRSMACLVCADHRYVRRTRGST